MEILVIILILIVASPLLLILFAWGAHSYKVEKDEEQRLNDRFSHRLKCLERGEAKDLIYCRKSDNLQIKILAELAKAIINDHPKHIQKIAKEYPDIYSIIEPSLYNIYVNYAKALSIKEKFSSAIIWYKMAYELKQDDKICSYLGYSYLQLQDYKNALFYLEKSIKNFFVLYNLFIITLYLKQYKETLYYFSELRKNYPSELEKKGKLLTKIPLEHLTEEIL